MYGARSMDRPMGSPIDRWVGRPVEGPMLDVRDLTAGYAGRPVLRGVSLAARGGESVALLGPNGGGKTTLLRCISGVLRPQGGGIRLADRPLEGLRPRERARLAAVVPQRAECPSGLSGAPDGHRALSYPLLAGAADGGGIRRHRLWPPRMQPGSPAGTERKSAVWSNCGSGCVDLGGRRTICKCWTSWPPAWIWPAWWSSLICWSAAGPPEPACSWPCMTAIWPPCMQPGSWA